MGLLVAIGLVGGGERGKRLEGLAPGEGLALGIGPGETPVERRADRLAVALGEIGEEGTVSRFRRMLVVGGGGAADDERASGARGERCNGDGRNHQAAHGASPVGTVGRRAIMAVACSPRAAGSRS